jgi:hypothetical protein
MGVVREYSGRSERLQRAYAATSACPGRAGPPGEFQPEPITEPLLEPLDSYGSCPSREGCRLPLNPRAPSGMTGWPVLTLFETRGLLLR